MPKADYYRLCGSVESLERSERRQQSVGRTPSPEAILAIDPGTSNLAAAYMGFNADGHLKYVETAKFTVPETMKTTFGKLTYIQSCIEEWLGEKDFGLLCKESVAHYMKFGVADAGRIQHMIESIAFAHDRPWIDVNPQAMRTYMNSQSKSDTKLAIYKRHRIELPSEDEADAFAIGMTGMALLRGEFVSKKKGKKR